MRVRHMHQYIHIRHIRNLLFMMLFFLTLSGQKKYFGFAYQRFMHQKIHK